MNEKMKILIVSDTHRNNKNYLKVLVKEGPFDLVIHAGDAEGSEYLLEESAKCHLEIVLGNNDFFSSLPKESEFELGKYKILLTHGHNYYVSMDNDFIKKEAIARGKNMVIYGHTHKPCLEVNDELTVINPGSLTYPRQEGKRPSYILMSISDENDAEIEIKYLTD